MSSSLYPSIFSLPHEPLPSDSQVTPTLIAQSDTEHLLETLLTTISPIDSPSNPTVLRRGEHSLFLGSTLHQLSGRYVMLDASRPWLLFWTAHSLDLLGIKLGPDLDRRAVSTILHFLSPRGGAAGGSADTQAPQLLPTYASTCTLAITGNPGPDGGWVQLAEHRQATYDFFMRCKRPDGSFKTSEDGEVDVRGTYCLLVVATLLDILTPELLHNVDICLSSLQTYEGGFANFTYPFDNGSGLPMAEAHGGNSHCALLAYFLISCVKPPRSAVEASSLGEEFPKPIDVDNALRFHSLLQGEAIEGGGFRGRSNKLVDGCYSWWAAGSFPVLEELSRRERAQKGKVEIPPQRLFNRVALQEYTLLAAQREEGRGGGLRDKPGMNPDLYHTCNNLAGLSTAQHHLAYTPSIVEENRKNFDASKGLPPIRPNTPSGGWKSEEERQAVRREVWASALGWEEAGKSIVLGGDVNLVNATTPVFNLLPHRLKPFINFFYGQTA